MRNSHDERYSDGFVEVFDFTLLEEISQQKTLSHRGG